MKHINEAIIKEAKGGIEEYEGTLTPGMKVIVEVHEDSDYFKVHSFKKAKEFFNYYSFDMDQDEHYRPKDFEKALDTMEVGESISDRQFIDMLGESATFYRVY